MDLLIYHNTILDLLRKERLDIPTSDVIDEFTHLAQLDLFQSCFCAYGTSQKSQDMLAPFRVDGSFTSDPTGFVSWPIDYGHLLAVSTITYDNARQTSNRRKVQILQDDKLSEALDNQVRVVSSDWPVGESKSNGVQLYPRVQASGVLTYLKMPKAPKFVFTLSGRTVTYNANDSVQLLWNDLGIVCLMSKTLAYLGLNINENQLIQFSQLQNQEVKHGN